MTAECRQAPKLVSGLTLFKVIASVALLATACVASAQSKWYAGAKKEGSVVFYTSDKQSLQDAMKAVFEKRYPGVILDARSNQPNTETREKILAEFGAKRTSIDIWLSGFTSGAVLLAAGALETYQSPDLKLTVTPKLSAPFNPIYGNFQAIAVNTNLVPAGEEPKTWKDLLNPKWKGKIASEDPRTGGTPFVVFAGLYNVYGEAFLRALAQQNVFFANQRGVLETGLAKGEYAILPTALNQYLQMKSAGAPVRLVRMTDGVGLSFNILYHTKNAPHPNAAKLFMDWTLSEEGQNVLAAQGMAPIRKGVKASNPEAALEGLRFFPSIDTPTILQDTRARNKVLDEIYFKR